MISQYGTLSFAEFLRNLVTISDNIIRIACIQKFKEDDLYGNFQTVNVNGINPSNSSSLLRLSLMFILAYS